MIRQEKGVTLTTLIIVIIVMIILASITIAASQNLRNKAKLKNLQTSMMLIQAKIEDIYNKYEAGNTKDFPTEGEGDEAKAVLPGEDFNDDDIKSKLYSSQENKEAEDKYIKHLTSDMKGAEDLGFEVESDDFYVNYKTGEVYSETGYSENGSETKHLLSELKNF